MSHWTLAQLTNLGVAAEVLLTGRTARPAPEAGGWGVANRALPAAEVLDHALRSPAISPRMSRPCPRRCPNGCCGTAYNGYSPRQVAALETQLHHRVMGTR